MSGQDMDFVKTEDASVFLIEYSASEIASQHMLGLVLPGMGACR